MVKRLEQRILRWIVPDFKIVFDWGNEAPGEDDD